MKDIIFFVALFGMMLVMSMMTGCVGDEDASKNEPKQAVPKAAVPQAVPEPAGPQGVVEQEAMLHADNNVTISQKTEPAQVPETQPIESGKATDAQPTGSAVVKEAQSAVQEILDVIMIENKVYTTDKKGPVEFSHLKHNKEYEVSCVECHHLYQDGKNIWKEGDHVEKCVVCHDPAEEKEKAIKLQSAFHNNCKDCHTEASKEGKEAPYKKCADCHGE